MALDYNSAGIVLIKGRHKYIMSTLLSGQVGIRLTESPYPSETDSISALLASCEDSFRPIAESGSEEIPGFIKEVKKRVKKYGVAETSDFAEPLDKVNGHYNLKHLIQLYGDIDGYEDFKASLERAEEDSDFDSIILITGNHAGNNMEAYNWVTCYPDGTMEFYEFADKDGALGTSIINKVAYKNLKATLISTTKPDTVQEKEEELPKRLVSTEESEDVIREIQLSEDIGNEPVELFSTLDYEIPADASRTTEEYIEWAANQVEEDTSAKNKKAMPEKHSEFIPERERKSGVVRFYAGSGMFRIAVARQDGTGKVYNHGFMTLPDVSSYVAGAYSAFRDASKKIYDGIDCRKYDYSVMYESTSFGAVSEQISLATLIGLCSSNLDIPVLADMLLIGDMDSSENIIPDADISSALDTAIEEGYHIALIPEENGRSVGGKDAHILCLYYRTPAEAVKLALGLDK